MYFSYPQSSCDSYLFPPESLSTVGPETNLGIRNINTKAFLHTDRQSLGSKIGPDPNAKGDVILNPQVRDENLAKDFFPVTCSLSGCDHIQYASEDPRLVNAAVPMTLTLNQPPATSSVSNQDIYSPSLNNYGQNYKQYSDISAGQITYYIDDSIKAPFHSPNFTNQAVVSAQMYQDPMGGLKPQYTRSPIVKPPPVGSLRNCYEGCLSWIEDSQNQREEIMSTQISKSNNHKYSARWFDF